MGGGRAPRSPEPADDPIDVYLDQLLIELRGRARGARRILTEAEAGLRIAAAEAVAAGHSQAQAAELAIKRLGRPRELAQRHAPDPARLLAGPVLAELAASVLLLATVGLLALGASGLLSGGLGLAFGKDFVAGDAPGVTYTPTRCADYREYEPTAPTCAAAAAAHHFAEVVGNQVAAA